MKKILIAINNDFTRKAYSEVFSNEKFKVLKVKNGKEALNLAIEERPDIILADISLSEMGGFELLKSLKEETSTKGIPVIIFSQLEKEEDENKAMKLEAKDFIVGARTSLRDVVRRIKVHLGREKTYRLPIAENLSQVAKELAGDLGYVPTLRCPNCDTSFILLLTRDLSKGEDYFKASFICPKCFQGPKILKRNY